MANSLGATLMHKPIDPRQLHKLLARSCSCAAILRSSWKPSRLPISTRSSTGHEKTRRGERRVCWPG
ncbi:hypothetical protein [Comamonas sp. JC664]|uniref:hypothetical protein n=1 Tax=Comamonas sp. JC664 TaxID=2801917 RepID=UPI00361E99CE